MIFFILAQKSRNRFFLIIFFLFFTFPVSATLGLKPKKEIVMITMPKSGTHLLMKFWYLLTGQYPYTHPNADHHWCYYWEHFYSNSETLLSNLNDPKKIVVMNIRDPRDVCVSAVYHLLNSPNSWLDSAEKERFSAFDFNEQLSYVLNDTKHTLSPLFYLKQLIDLLKDPMIMVCSFEKLVGISGGGDTELQVEQIFSITNAFDLNLSQIELDYLVESIHGLHETKDFSSTFRCGQIGLWKECFTEEHIKICKKNMGMELIQLGYEKDYDW
jgi:hypothetical protein